jgi:hypothetical protein
MSNTRYWNKPEKPWKKNHKMAEFSKLSPFRTTRIVQSQIQEFLDAVSMAILAYQEGMIAYLKGGWQEKAEENAVAGHRRYLETAVGFGSSA